MSRKDAAHQCAIHSEKYAEALSDYEAASQSTIALTAECEQLCEDLIDCEAAAIIEIVKQQPLQHKPAAAFAAASESGLLPEPLLDGQEAGPEEMPEEMPLGPVARERTCSRRNATVEHDDFVGCLSGLWHAR